MMLGQTNETKRCPATALCAAALAASLASSCAPPIDIVTDVAYLEAIGARGEMDLYVPVRQTETTRPGVMLIHGGGWSTGGKWKLQESAIRLASSGYVVASTNYRIVPEGAFPVALQDVACALAFFRERGVQWGLDPDRVAVMGYSAGGHLASLLALTRGEEDLVGDCPTGELLPPQAVVSGAGPMDMLDLASTPIVTAFLGGTPEERPEAYTAASPAHLPLDEAPPFLLIHGTRDSIVPCRHSELMHERLLAAGRDSTLLLVPGGGHVTNPSASGGGVTGHMSTHVPEAWIAIAAFLEQTIGLPP